MASLVAEPTLVTGLASFWWDGRWFQTPVTVVTLLLAPEALVVTLWLRVLLVLQGDGRCAHGCAGVAVVAYLVTPNAPGCASGFGGSGS